MTCGEDEATYPAAMADQDAKEFVNVPVSRSDEKRIAREERTWTGRRLSVLCVVFLGICLVALYVMAQTTSETTWTDWLLPWPTGKG